MKMSSLSKIGLGLSVVFICLLLALVAEIYYLLWWKRRIIRRKIEDDYNNINPRREFIYHFCWKNPLKSSVNTEIPTTTQMQEASFEEQELQFDRASNEFFIGQPRFLFTINEETKEDLESEDGKSTIREGKRSLSDLLKIVESNATPPYLTPISSPHVYVTPPITPLGSCCQSGVYNPFYEASNDAEFSKIVRTSPPPKFKFLRDAEEKLQRRILMFEQAKEDANNNEQNDGSFIKIIVAKNNNENDKTNHHNHSPHCPSGDSSSSSCPSSSQAFPLGSQHLPPSNRKFKNFSIL